MEIFNKIFLINLDNEIGRERLAVCDEHLKEQGIEYERWVAVEKENGAHGLLATMKELFEYCVLSGFTNVLVLEDDAKMLLPFWPFVKEIWPQLPADYHCLFLGCNLLSKPVRHSANILRIRSSYATHAICYSLEGMKLILKLFEEPEVVPYDIVLMKGLQYLGKSYCTFPMLCIQREGYSSIEKRVIDWGKNCLFTYHAHTYNI